MKKSITLELEDEKTAKVDGENITPEMANKFINHGADEFRWGWYDSAGGRCLALAICLHLFPAAKATHVYKNFHNMYITPLPAYPGTVNKTIDISVFINRYKGEGWQDTKTLLGQ